VPRKKLAGDNPHHRPDPSQKGGRKNCRKSARKGREVTGPIGRRLTNVRSSALLKGMRADREQLKRTGALGKRWTHTPGQVKVSFRKSILQKEGEILASHLTTRFQ